MEKGEDYGCQVSVCLSPEQKEYLSTVAELYGMSRSEYCRKLVCDDMHIYSRAQGMVKKIEGVVVWFKGLF